MHTIVILLYCHASVIMFSSREDQNEAIVAEYQLLLHKYYPKEQDSEESTLAE